MEAATDTQSLWEVLEETFHHLLVASRILLALQAYSNQHRTMGHASSIATDRSAPHAFFFNANAKGVSSFYGAEFDPAFLAALSAADTQGTVCSRVLRGDALVEMLCTRVTAVSNSERGQSWTQGYDLELYKTVIWDLADAFAGQWNTLNLESFPTILARNRVHCIVLPTLLVRFRDQIDQSLRSTSAYLGSVEIDAGNPLQTRLLFEQLIDDAFIRGGAVCLERGWEGTDNTVFYGASEFLPSGEQRLPFESFHEQRPSYPEEVPLSERGKSSIDRYEGKQVYTIEDRILYALYRLQKPGSVHFSFAVSSTESTVVEADLPEAKFVKYLLNPEHKEGSGKAKFFRDVLSIEADNWRYLAAQFYEGLRRASVSELKIKAWQDGFGASFNCVLPITGLNGRVANVFTNWIMKPGQLPQLSTAIPEAGKHCGDLAAQEPDIVSALLPEQERWNELYRLAREAGTLAAEQSVPTPMKVHGFSVEMEGMCGSASIRVPDARRGFARWLLRTGNGSPHYKSGAMIFSFHPSQSIDRAVAYAKAFATVLKLNGIECTVESHID